MIHKIDKIKNTNQLKFDDHIRGQFLGGKYTHYVYNEPAFLMEENIKGNWETLNFYCIGLSSLKSTINKFDLKKLRI